MYPPTPSGRPSHSWAPDEDPFYFVSNSDLVEPTITLQGSSVYPDHFSHVPGFATTPSGEPGSGGGPSTPHGGRDDEDLGGSGSGSGSGSGNLTEQEWTELTRPGVVLPSSAVEPSPSPALVPSLERGWGLPEHGSSGGSQGVTPPASVFVPGSSDMPSSLPPTPGSGEVDRATGSGAVHPWDRDTVSPDARVTAPGLGGSDVTDDAGNKGVTRDPWAWPPTRSNSGDGVTDDGWWWGSTPGPATDRPHGRSTPEVVTEEPFWFSTVRVGGEEAGLRPTTKGLPNSPPYRANPINVLVAELGRYFEFAIPDDTFGDREDGDTRRLSLNLALPYDQSLPPNFWLKLDPVHQELKGLPLAVDLDSNYHYVMLEARDAQGMVARDAIKLVVNSSNYVKFTHRFTLRLQVHFASFMADRDNLAQLLWKLATYVGDHSPMYMTVLEVKPGSLELSWSNNSYSGDDCHNASLARLLHRLVRRDGSPRTSLQRHLGPDLPLASVEFSPLGACLEGEATTLGASPLPPRPNEDSGLSIWAQVVLPVLIALLLLLFILLIVLLIYRRRRQQQKPPLQSWEKPAFNNDRNPIIFPDEVEGGDDPALRPKKPTLLPSDQPPASTATSTRPYYFEGEEPLPPQPTHSNTGSLDSRGRSSTGRRTPKPPPYCWAGGENDPPPYRLPPPYHKESSTDV